MNGSPPDTHHLVCFALADQRNALELSRVRRSNRAFAVTPLPGAPAAALALGAAQYAMNPEQIADLLSAVVPRRAPPSQGANR